MPDRLSVMKTLCQVAFVMLATVASARGQQAVDSNSSEASTEQLALERSNGHTDLRAHVLGSRPSFLFTGKLFGYFRLPDKQTLEDGSDPTNPCPSRDKISSGEKQMSRDATVFMEIRRRNLTAILLGTGDNFSPNYYSRVIVPGSSRRTNYHKERYEWDWGIPHPGWTLYKNISDSLWKELREGEGTLPTDNVACFLSYANYKAIVPGKHDFYYGPERVRQLARFLAGIPENGGYHPVQMLGANLVIQTTWAKDHKPIADSMKHQQLIFDTQYGRSDSRQKVEIEDFTDNGFVYPSLRRIKIKFTGWEDDDPHGVKVFLCEAAKEGDPDSIYTPASDDTCNGVPYLTESVKPPSPSPSEKTVFPPTALNEIEIEYNLPRARLRPNSNYGICLSNPDSPRASTGPTFYCFRFAVFIPFFQSPDTSLAAHGSIIQFKNPKPYVVAKLPDGGHAAIFGVVDPALTASIGNLNYSWKNLRVKKAGTIDEKMLGKADLKYKTVVSISDPLKALTQLQQEFEEDHPKFRGLRVLLAQMPPSKARALAAQLKSNLRFDAVISAADDSEATPNATIQLRPTVPGDGEKPDNATGLQPPSVLFVPPTHQASRNHLARRWVNVRELYVSTDHTQRWTYKLAGEPARVNLPTFDKDPSTSFWAEVCRSLYAEHPDHQCIVQDGKVLDAIKQGTSHIPPEWDENKKKDAIQQLALLTVQKHVDSDLAMLQQRDFYLDGLEEFYVDHCEKIEQDGKCASPEFDGNALNKLDVQEILDRILWKGDFIYHISVQGSTLKTVLDESKAYSGLEKSPVAAVDEQGRAAVTAGVYRDVGREEYRINDEPLDPGRLYTVATSDYIALGDTGYPELGNPPVGDPPDPISSKESFESISALVCRTLVGLVGRPTAEDVSKLNCDGPVTDYFDDFVGHKPNDTRAGDTQAHKIFVWTFLRGRLGQPSDWERDKNHAKQDIPSETDERVQDRPTTVVSISKLSIGFDGLSHNLTESELKSDFGGIPNIQVTAKHFHSWDNDVESDVERFGKRWDSFLSESLQYSAKFTSQVAPPRDINQSTDVIAIDLGAYVHAHEKALPRFQWLIDGHFETQPFRPFSSVTINPVGSITTPESLIFTPNRSRLALARTGPRWQNRKSYLEVGGEAGANFDAIKEFDVKTSQVGPLVLTCPLEAEKTLNKCVNDFNAANPTAPIDATFFVQTANETRRRFGIFWNSSLTIPLDPRVTFQVDNQGDYFFPSARDNSTDTRFRHQYTQAIKLYVFPNLDFEPTYKIFLFENKVENHFLFQQELMIKINLAFDLWNWRERRQELRYQKPSPK